MFPSFLFFSNFHFSRKEKKKESQLKTNLFFKLSKKQNSFLKACTLKFLLKANEKPAFSSLFKHANLHLTFASALFFQLFSSAKSFFKSSYQDHIPYPV